MGSQGRGQLGVVFLVAALIMMPVLVFSYDPSTNAHASDAGGLPRTTDGAATGTATGTATGMLTPEPTVTTSPSARAGPAIVEIEGVGDGRTVRGTTQIWAFVEGDVGGVLFRVEGAQARFAYVADQAPYLLDPHDPQIGGWDTTFVPNGEYTLTALSIKDLAVWRSVRFTVRNR